MYESKVVSSWILSLPEENSIWHFMQIDSNGDNMDKMSNIVLWENKKTVSKCRLLIIQPRVLSVKGQGNTDK